MASSETATAKQIITIGTRRSQLARVQTDAVVDMMRKAFPEYEYRIHAMDPLGDRDKVTALYRFNNDNAKGLWTHELEEMLLAGALDLVVHSLKDMPTALPPKLAVGAIFKREDPRDAVVVKPSALPLETCTSEPLTAHKILSSLPTGSIIGTSSLRRIAQLRRIYSHLEFKDVRGNVPTRLKKLDAPESFAGQEVPSYAALILAAAGLKRLDLGHRITAYLHSKDGGVLHAVGQGAIAVEIREGDERIGSMLEKLGDWRTERACLAERSVMRTLEGGCSVPIGVETEWASEEDDTLILRAAVVGLDGKDAGDVEDTAIVTSREEANDFGKRVAKLLVERGAGKILDQVNAQRRADAASPPRAEEGS